MKGGKNVNQVALVGRITKDPVLRKLSEGRLQTSFILAVNRNFKNQQGEVGTDFILCTAWGKTAENTAKHCGKGSLVGVGGRIQSRTYEREDNTRVFVTEVIGEEIRFLSTKRRENDNMYEDHGFGTKEANTRAVTTEQDDAKKNFHLPQDEKDGLPIF